MDNEREHQEKLMLYGVTANELSSLKSKQWSLTSNTFFLFVAITAIGNFIGENIVQTDKFWLSALAILVLIMSSVVLYKLKVATDNREGIYKALAESFHSSNKEILQSNQKRFGPPSYYLLQVAILIGTIISIWIIKK